MDKPTALTEISSLRRSMREIILSVFIFIYLLVTMLWLQPESPAKEMLLSPVKNFWMFCGFDQSWSLFSPKIRELNYYPSAIITFEDGTKTIWEPVRMDTLNYWDKFRKEKYRKWSIDALCWSPFSAFWPDFARNIGRQYYNENNKPVSLALSLHWKIMPPPVEPIIHQDRLPERTSFNPIFNYRYTKDDFKQESKQ